MKFDFIKVNKSILDYSEYVRSVLLLGAYLKHRAIETLIEEGFRLEFEKTAGYHSFELVFYLPELDLEARFTISKRNEEEFA